MGATFLTKNFECTIPNYQLYINLLRKLYFFLISTFITFGTILHVVFRIKVINKVLSGEFLSLPFELMVIIHTLGLADNHGRTPRI